MATISASMVKELREKTGAGMMDSKNALVESGGDMEAAVDWLRKKGLAQAAKKAGRVAAEGLVGLKAEGGSGVIVEVNSETDFVARNEQFQDLVRTVAAIALEKSGDFDATAATPYPGTDKTVADHISEMVGVIGENLSLRRVGGLTVEPGVVAGYLHNAAADGLGRIGVVVALKSTAPADALLELGRKVAMHGAATHPLSLSPESLDPGLVAREREVLSDQARASGKPENIIEKMVEGRLRKFYEEVVLLHQPFVLDPDKTVGKAVEEAGKELGAPVTVEGFLRFALGEGIEKDETDFASEVAEVAGRA